MGFFFDRHADVEVYKKKVNGKVTKSNAVNH
jgi:hypothetical protein